MEKNKTGQVSEDAAKVYEEFYLPALFEEWTPIVIEAADIRDGNIVLDVACGTGVLATAILEQTGVEGAVYGIDVNGGMLDVARSKTSKIDWIQSPAESLPLQDCSVDHVVCQFGLMFFQNPKQGLQEMMRVLRPGGSLVVVVWDRLDEIPGFSARVELWRKLFGEQAVDDAPCSLGDTSELTELFNAAGITNAKIETRKGTARYPSIRNWMHTTTKGWTQENALDDEQFGLLLREAQHAFSKFEKADGTVTFPTSAHIVTARKVDR